MNLVHRSACQRRPNVVTWALTVLLLLASKPAASQGSRPQQTAPVNPASARAQTGNSLPGLTPQELQRYDQAKTVMDWTPEQIRDVPELQDLQPAQSQQELPAILGAAGERVSALLDDLPNMASMEEVRSGPCDEGLRKKCRVTYRGKFNYLVLVHPTESNQLMGEYRTDLKGRPIDYRNLGHGRILLTYGFTTTPLRHFHPQNQASCRFRDFGRQSAGGQMTEVVGFVEIPGKYPWPTEWRHGNAVAALYLQGLAWIDVTTHQIVRIETFLVTPPADGDLESLKTRVEFSAIQLRQASSALWLPTEVVVDVSLHHHHFRNVHRYSTFKTFQVETRIGPAEEK
jgi:hypothetical protein